MNTHTPQINMEDYDFNLPESLIAARPAPKRRESRLMCVLPESNTHQHFSDLPSFLKPGDVLILNQSKVLAARLFLKKETGAKVEILCERISKNSQFAWVQAQSNRPLRQGQKLHSQGEHVITIRKRAGRFWLLESSQKSWWSLIEEEGQIPLPPYMMRDADDTDKARYQTVYAKDLGSVAAPTAGLHFDEAMLEALRKKGILLHYITLHVGAGTFLPIKDKVEDHQMHTELYSVDESVCSAIREAKKEGRRILAVGTTSLRALESAARASEDGLPKPGNNKTQLFVRPGFNFRVVDGLITNFHFPRSSLMLLVAAFAGKKTILRAYHEAIEKQYRFFSYGDSMLLWRTPQKTTSKNQVKN